MYTLLKEGSMMEKPHKKLDVWQRSMDLVVNIYDLTRMFPGNEGMV